MVRATNHMVFILLLIISVLLVSSCSSVPKSDDVVRIKPEHSKQWEQFNGPKGPVIRNGNALRGTVLNITKEVIVNCETKDTTTSYFINFLDSLANSNMSYVEKIPLEHAILVGQITPNLQKNQFENINYFENYSNPLNQKNLREVKVDSVFYGCYPCGCNRVDYSITGPCVKCITCPDCDYSWYFLELRYGYAIYSDIKYDNNEIGRDANFGEIAFGYRSKNHWGLGLAFNYGIKAFNQFDTNFADINRYFLLLHGRYSFVPPKKDEGYPIPILKPIYDFAARTCTRPVVYAQYGIALDSISMDLMKVTTCSDCESKITYKPGNLNLSLPTSYAIGIGLDIPIPKCFFDLSLDLSYRSYDIADRMDTGEFWNVPSRRTLNMLVFRLGITF